MNTKKSKKLISILTSTLLIANAVPAFAEVDNSSTIIQEKELGRMVNSNYYETFIDPYDIEGMEYIIESYELMPETAEAMRDYSVKCLSGDVENGKMTLSTKYNPYSKARRYYTGYKNKRYLEETLFCDGMSNPTPIKTGSNYSSYAKNTLKVLISTKVESILGASWTVMEILGSLPSGVPALSQFQHEARLVENKTQRFTYIEPSTGDGYMFGSREEQSEYEFENVLAFPGVGSSVERNTPLKTYTTDGFYSPDESAYYGYVNGGDVQVIYDFKYGGVTFDSISGVN